ITRGCTALIAGTSWPSLNRDSEEGSATSSVADPSRATPRKRYSKGSQAIREPQPRRLGSRFASDPSDTSSDPGPSPTCSQVLSSRISIGRKRARTALSTSGVAARPAIVSKAILIYTGAGVVRLCVLLTTECVWSEWVHESPCAQGTELLGRGRHRLARRRHSSDLRPRCQCLQ